MNNPPVINNYDTLSAADGIGPVSLKIAVPTDADNDPLTVTITEIPGYGTIEYFDGATFVAITSTPTTLTPEQLASLEYTPDHTGEHGGGKLTYSVSDGTDTRVGTIAIFDVTEAFPVEPVLVFSAERPDDGVELFATDGASVLPPIDLAPSGNSYAGSDGGFFSYAGVLFFMANSQLYVLDPINGPAPFDAGSAGGTGGALSDIMEDAHFTEFAGNLYFRAITAGGDHLAEIMPDGTAVSIVLNPGGQSAAPGRNVGFTELTSLLLGRHRHHQRLQSRSHQARPERKLHRNLDTQHGERRLRQQCRRGRRPHRLQQCALLQRLQRHPRRYA